MYKVLVPDYCKLKLIAKIRVNEKEIYCGDTLKADFCFFFFLHQQDCIDTTIVFWIVCNLRVREEGIVSILQEIPDTGKVQYLSVFTPHHFTRGRNQAKVTHVHF